MKKRLTAITLLITTFGATFIYHANAERMHDITVDLGKNIQETAEASGAPRFSIGSFWGAKIYDILDMPPEISVRLNRSGHNIVLTSRYSLTMYADSDNKNNLGVERI